MSSSTLLLQFAAPLQAWGSSSRFNVRGSEYEPTKSAVIGLVASALGRRRDEPIHDLTEMRFGVRIDQPGRLINDFHTAHSFDGKQSFVSNRYYIADAIFLIGLEANEEMLDRIDSAIRQPAFPLFLGRRSCPPSQPISLGVRRGATLEYALENEPWLASYWYRKKQTNRHPLEIIKDSDYGIKGSFLKADLPVSFSQKHRQYENRSVLSTINAAYVDNPDGKISHDAMEAF